MENDARSEAAPIAPGRRGPKRIALALACFEAVRLLLGLFFQPIDQPNPFQAAINWLIVGIILLLAVLVLTFVNQVHWDLWRLYDEYPIKPDDALLNTLIPGLNLFFWWKMWRTAANHLPAPKGSRLPAIDQLLPWSYLLLAVTMITSAGDSLGARVLSFLTDAGLCLFFYLLAESVLWGLKEQSRRTGKILVEAD